MSNLPEKLLRLLSVGRLTFSKREVPELFGMDLGAFEDASQRAIGRGLLLHPRRGFYVVVSPQQKVCGAPPPAEIIDDLMRFEGASYYVGLLKAAEIHGAAHQAVMAFQVVSPKRMPSIPFGRAVIEFYFTKSLAPAGLVERRQTDAGYFVVSSAALTAVDLLRYPRAAGSIDAAASVIGDLAEQIDPSMIGRLHAVAPTPTLQRLGYIFDHVGASALANEVEKLVGNDGRRVELDSFSSGHQGGPGEEFDRRWKVVAPRPLELDNDSQETRQLAVRDGQPSSSLFSADPAIIGAQIHKVTKMPPHIRTALSTFAQRVKSAYGDDFVEVVLFGSQARGEATEDSDIDVAVILKTVNDRRAVRDRLAEIAYDVLLESGEDMHAIAISREQWEAPEMFSNPSLIRAMKQDGLAIGGP